MNTDACEVTSSVIGYRLVASWKSEDDRVHKVFYVPKSIWFEGMLPFDVEWSSYILRWYSPASFAHHLGSEIGSVTDCCQSLDQANGSDGCTMFREEKSKFSHSDLSFL